MEEKTKGDVALEIPEESMHVYLQVTPARLKVKGDIKGGRLTHQTKIEHEQSKIYHDWRCPLEQTIDYRILHFGRQSLFGCILLSFSMYKLLLGDDIDCGTRATYMSMSMMVIGLFVPAIRSKIGET
jgi:hypothetical protein